VLEEGFYGAVVVPEEEREGEERQVVVGALEVGEERQDYDDDEELADVLGHCLNYYREWGWKLRDWVEGSWEIRERVERGKS
jgi:hypothetical protein